MYTCIYSSIYSVTKDVRVACQPGESRYIPVYAYRRIMAVAPRDVRICVAIITVTGIASLCGVAAASSACHNHYITHFGSVQRHTYLHELCTNALNNYTAFRASLVCGSPTCTTNILVHEALRYRPSEFFESECTDTLMQQCTQLVQACATYNKVCCSACDFSHRDSHAIGTRYMASYDTVTVVLIAIYIVLLVASAKIVFVSFRNAPKMPIYSFYPTRAVDHP